MSNVLLIEPDKVLAAAYTQAFEHAGHKVTHATSAQAAIDAADRQQPDLVVLELQLVITGGIGFLQEFRSYDEWARVPVIVNTLIAPEVLGASRQLLQLTYGVNECFYKPQTSLDQLVRAVRTALS